MLTEQTYHLVFFDVDKPQDEKHAITYTGARNLIMNISDDIINKYLELVNNDGQALKYKVTAVKRFSLTNSMYNQLFCIVSVKRISDEEFKKNYRGN